MRINRYPVSSELVSINNVNRDKVEQYLTDCYFTAYKAKLTSFMPTLLSQKDAYGKICGALGVRQAQDDFFLEQYLSQPAQDALSQKIGQVCSRDKIVEVGNFASTIPGGSRWLILALTSYLHTKQKKWALMTAVSRLQNSFLRMGIDLVDLAVADINLLNKSEHIKWGKYYNEKPRVMAVSVASSKNAIIKLIGNNPSLKTVWEDAANIKQAA